MYKSQIKFNDDNDGVQKSIVHANYVENVTGKEHDIMHKSDIHFNDDDNGVQKSIVHANYVENVTGKEHDIMHKSDIHFTGNNGGGNDRQNRSQADQDTVDHGHFKENVTGRENEIMEKSQIEFLDDRAQQLERGDIEENRSWVDRLADGEDPAELGVDVRGRMERTDTQELRDREETAN